jgi:anti-sigma-K factor RskA
MSDIEIHHLGAAYALDALDARERSAFEAHYASCDICRSDVTEFRATAAALGELVATPPPGDLRARVLAEIATTRQLSPLPDGVERLLDRRRRHPVTVALAVAAAAVCFVAGAVVVGSLRNDGFDDTVAAMMQDPDAQVIRLADIDGSDGSVVRVVWTDDRVALLGDGLTVAPEGQAYELWLIDASGATPMRILDPAGDGSIERVAEISGAPATWGITLEPEAGSDTPTLPILYAADVT